MSEIKNRELRRIENVNIFNTWLFGPFRLRRVIHAVPWLNRVHNRGPCGVRQTTIQSWYVRPIRSRFSSPPLLLPLSPKVEGERERGGGSVGVILKAHEGPITPFVYHQTR